MQVPSLYHPAYEHDACGLGFVARADGRASHEIVEQGLEILRNLTHRGATGSDARTGDGAGVLLQVPDALLRRECRHLGVILPPAGDFGVGMVFLTPDPERRHACEREVERIAAEEGHSVLGWRDVPVQPEEIGVTAASCMPVIRQVFMERGSRDRAGFERKLYVIRRRLHHVIHERHEGSSSCYIASLSARTIVYKGLLQGTQVARFYPDLADPVLTSAIALVHARFSTNTLGSWPLAHPYRYVAHNGEINTLRGNVNWMRAREAQFRSRLFGADMDKIRPIVEPHVSDSAAFDNALELLVLAGRSLPHALMAMVPPAWEKNEDLDPDLRAFYEYHGSLMEPWDGPAAIAFTDGTLVGATLDRNGLRPARYSITRDGLVVLASEEGALGLPPEDVIVRWRLQPGHMLVVDTARGLVLEDDEIKREVATRRPYSRWVTRATVPLADLPEHLPVDWQTDTGILPRLQRAFGYTMEDLRLVLPPMAQNAKEPDGSMGTDTPLAVLSERPQMLFAYFKQLFAQVTNPPIDPLREETVMSLTMSLGPERNLLHEIPERCRRVQLDQPILSAADLEKLTGPRSPFRCATLALLFPTRAGEKALETSLDALCRRAREAVQDGAEILVLSDRGVDEQSAPIPSLLAVSAVHHDLVRAGTRTRVGLVIETGEAREVHHMALLIGYGAAAIHPYLAFDTLRTLAGAGLLEGVDAEEACTRYVSALNKGLLKILSKMGISTLFSYCGAQIFEAVGLDSALIDRHFTGTASRIGGIGLEGIAHETLERHTEAFACPGEPDLELGGEYQMRPQGEYHQWNPDSIASLQRAARARNFASFQEFTDHFDCSDARLSTLRGLLDFIPDPVPLSEVEPAQEIVKRFSTGAMSFGSLSREAHETIAVAMNRIDAKSNTGEGGEEPERFLPDGHGDSRRSAIKQVASGRFGVTAGYLVHADVLQIKMAQGSKPGEGGQLPGHKVSPDIARVRLSTTGVGLISPPPHHDIYSIEDLAQLIHDLKSVNPMADISVKLVSEVGVGTIAAGVAKAKAEQITISGHDGGTGASPLSSIKYAGLPWELGLAETQQVLVRNDLRGRVRLQVDGHLKTGRDVVVAALLGAEEFAFSTAPLVAMGCIMMRACHLNTCPVGIATQDPDLRRRFAGKPEHVINYFFFLAEQVRRLMADLGFRNFDEMVGRTDRLTPRAGKKHWKAAQVDLRALLSPPDRQSTPLHQVEKQDHALAQALDHELIRRSRPALEEGRGVRIGMDGEPVTIRNVDRSAGALLAGEMARWCGEYRLPDDTIQIALQGTAGQSFGAWAPSGLTLALEGETNDYAGKGLSGGRLIVSPPRTAAYDPERSIVVGNVALYGATAGEAFFRGHAGERFAVRNSGAHAVVEGVGDHGCEYMTGGVVLVLGPTGRNFGAGMSGGTAFVLDMWGRFPESCNLEMIGLEPLEAREDIALVRRLLARHRDLTGSIVAARVLANWAEYALRFVKVMPHDLRGALVERHNLEEQAV